MNATNQQELLEQVFQHARQIGELENQYRLNNMEVEQYQRPGEETLPPDPQRQTPPVPVLMEAILEESAETAEATGGTWSEDPLPQDADPKLALNAADSQEEEPLESFLEKEEETKGQDNIEVIEELPASVASQKVAAYISTLEETNEKETGDVLSLEEEIPAQFVEPYVESSKQPPYSQLPDPFPDQEISGCQSTSEPEVPIQLSQNDFLTEEQTTQHTLPRETTPQVSPLEKFLNLFRSEEKLGTTWLLWIGGILLLIGAAIGASQIQSYISPGMRLVLGYGISGAIALAGWFVRNRNQMVQRGAVAISLSLSYFLSFASHYIEYTKVFENPVPSLLLMAGFAGGIVLLAEKWRSELVAGFGMALGVMAALISAPASANFALVALGILAVGSGVLLVRNEWTRLTALALIGTYLSSVGLWFIVGREGMVAGAITHLVALFIYHGIFSVAFWKWGRVWMARERLMETAGETEALPKVESGMLPYSRGFVIINSIGLISLSLLLLYVTKVHWAHVDWLLFTLAGLEIGRLVLPAFRREGLASFHLVVGMGLVCAGIVAAFNGMAESAVLAVQVLALVVAASRAKSLRWIRPLTIIPAMLTVRSYISIMPATLPEFIGTLMTPTMLFAATLPWERIMVRNPKPIGGVVLRTIDYLSGTMRAITATALVVIGTVGYLSDPGSIAIFLAATMVVLLVGLLLLSATTWIVPIFALGLFSLHLTMVSQFTGNSSTVIVYTVITLLLAGIYLWEENAKRPMSHVLRPIRPGLNICAAIAWTLMVIRILFPVVSSMGIAMLVLSVVLGAIYYATKYAGAVPSLVAIPDDETTCEDRRTLQWKLLSLPFIAMVSCLLIGMALTLVHDAPTSLLSTLVYSAVGLTVWGATILRKKATVPVTETFSLVIGLGILTAGTLVRFELTLDYLFIPLVPAITSFVIAWKRNRPESLTIASLSLSSLLIVTAICTLGVPFTSVIGVLTGLVLVTVMVLGTRVLHQITKDRENNSYWWNPVLTSCYESWVPLASVVALMLLLAPILFGGMFSTVFWGLYGILLLAAGFVFIDRTMRYTSFVVFGASVIKVFFFDLAGSDTPTKVVAFIGLGLLFIVSGVGYGFLSKRLLEKNSD